LSNDGWNQPVPGDPDYDFELHGAGLPEGVEAEESDQDTVEFDPGMVNRVEVAVRVSFQNNEREIKSVGRRAVSSGNSGPDHLSRNALARANKQVTDRMKSEPVEHLEATAVHVAIELTYTDAAGTVAATETAWHTSEGNEGAHDLAQDSLNMADLAAKLLIHKRFT
jgi:hypothetical protein